MGSLYRRKQKIGTDDQGKAVYRELPTIWIKYYQNGRAVRESTGTEKETVARPFCASARVTSRRAFPSIPRWGKSPLRMPLTTC
jgi:hypothetical protein